MTQHGKRSLQNQLLLPAVITICIFMLLFGGGLLLNFRQTLYSIQDEIEIMARSIRQEQQQALDKTEKEHLENTRQALLVKAESMAKLVARISSYPLLTYDFDVLDGYCADISKDPDVMLASLTDRENTLLTTLQSTHTDKEV